MARRLPDEMSAAIADEHLAGDEASFAAMLLDRTAAWCRDCLGRL